MPIVTTAIIVKTVLTAAAAMVAAVIVVKILTWAGVLEWFRRRAALKAADAANIALAIKQARADGKVTYVQGIFNTNTEELLDAQVFEAEELDADLQKLHSKNDLAILD
jgi:hypothetical protein